MDAVSAFLVQAGLLPPADRKTNFGRHATVNFDSTSPVVTESQWTSVAQQVWHTKPPPAAGVEEDLYRDVQLAFSEAGSAASCSGGGASSTWPGLCLGQIFKNLSAGLGCGVLAGLAGMWLREVWVSKLRFALFKDEILRYFGGKHILITGATSGMLRGGSTHWPGHGRVPGVPVGRLVVDLLQGGGNAAEIGFFTPLSMGECLAYRLAVWWWTSCRVVAFSAFRRAFKEPSKAEAEDLAQLLTVPQLANDPVFLDHPSLTEQRCNPNPLDMVFNNAGVSQRDLFRSLEVSPIKFLLNTNCVSNILYGLN
eukprot:g14595.t1